jgi:hypothetical protein
MFGAIGSIAAASLISQAIAAANPADTGLLKAWNERQTALAKIEKRGSFYLSEYHSAELTEEFDAAEMKVVNIEAATPRGLLCKLWVALAHSGGPVSGPEGRAQFDAIRRADYAEVTSFACELNFDSQCIWRVIQSLALMVEG